jgi:hypothetical protein
MEKAMPDAAPSTPLSNQQKDQICSILTFGCDRDTAAGVVECLVVDIGRAIADDPQFAIKVRRAEATAELRHMQNILNATKDGKYWRASVWWLERRAPERFGRRAAGTITSQQLNEAVAAWHDLLQREFATPDDEQRITACINEIYASIEMLLDAQSAAIMLDRFASPRPLSHDHANNTAGPSADQPVLATDD